MIAASEPQEFEPRGRRQVRRHPFGPASGHASGAAPGSAPGPSSVAAAAAAAASALQRRLSRVAISDDGPLASASFVGPTPRAHQHGAATPPGEQWSMRAVAAADGTQAVEEELYASGRTAVWSRGGASHATTKVVVSCFSCETPIRHALWVNFLADAPSLAAPDGPAPAPAAAPAPGAAPPPPPPPPPPPQQRPDPAHAALADAPEHRVSCVCLVDAETIRAFTSSGEDYAAAQQFQVRGAWASSRGLLLERGADASVPASAPASLPPPSPSLFPSPAPSPSPCASPPAPSPCAAAASPSASPLLEDSRASLWRASMASRVSLASEAPPLPTLFSLAHPLDEMLPVVARHGPCVSVMNDPCQRLVLVSEEPSLCLLFDASCGLHSAWAVRKATPEERVAALGGVAACASPPPPSAPHRGPRGSSVGSSVASVSAQPSPPPPPPPQPQGHRESWAVSVRSLAASGGGGRASSLGASSLGASFASSLGGSPATTFASAHAPLPDARLSASRAFSAAPGADVAPRPLLADVCLHHLWTEAPRRGGGPPAAASKAFLCGDLLGRRFLCYLLPHGALVLLRLLRPPPAPARRPPHGLDLGLALAHAATLPALDAAPLDGLGLLALLEPQGGVALLSASQLVAKVHVAGVPSALATARYLSAGPSPFAKGAQAKRNSGGAVASGVTSLFDEDLWQLSPVVPPLAPPFAPPMPPPIASTLAPPLAPLGTSSPHPVTGAGGHPTPAGRPLGVRVRVRLGQEAARGTSATTAGTPAGTAGPHAQQPTEGDGRGRLVALRDPVHNRLTLVLGDGSMYRISIPELYSSSLVRACVGAVRCALPEECLSLLLRRWVGARHAPGAADTSPQQEFALFQRLLLELCGYDVERLPLTGSGGGASGGVAAAKKKRASDAGSEDDWEYLLRSDTHGACGPHLAAVLGLRRAPPPAQPLPQPPTQPQGVGEAQVDEDAPLHRHMPHLLLALHLLYEELKLDGAWSEALPPLGALLCQLASDLRLDAYCALYWRDFPLACDALLPQGAAGDAGPAHGLRADAAARLLRAQPLPSAPPDVTATALALLRRARALAHASPTPPPPPEPFPCAPGLNPRSRDIVQLSALCSLGGVGGAGGAEGERGWLRLETFVRPAPLPSAPAGGASPPPPFPDRDAAPSARLPFPQRAALLMAEMGLGRRALQRLPCGLALPLHEALAACRGCPRAGWPRSACALLLRQDLAALSVSSAAHSGPTQGSSQGQRQTPPTHSAWSAGAAAAGAAAGKAAGAAAAAAAAGAAGAARAADSDEEDGMETLDSEVVRLRWAEDRRAAEARRLLRSSRPVRIAVAQRPEVSDHEFIEEQERHLYALCTRTMALPVGRGMLTLRTALPVPTEPLPVPRLCLTGRAPPRGTAVDLSHIEVVPNMNLWPLFHNGVAAGLRLAPPPPPHQLQSAWIVYNKPKGAAEVSTEHAGFLMALGLNGHLGALARWNAYEYLAKCHEMTSVGLLLGIAATKRGTMDVAATKMLSLHVEALLPPTSVELDVAQSVQVAALMGVGLVYQGTAHRRMAEVLLAEIGRPPGPEMENCVDRESYALAAGLALGMVVLGRGGQPDACGLQDLHVPDALHHYMVGGHRRPFAGAQKEKYKSPSYQIREGDQVSVDVTSPGATLALAMMFFASGNRAVADWLVAPGTQHLLDFVRPDLLLLRVCARALVLWDDVRPTAAWVEAQAPPQVRAHCLLVPPPHSGGGGEKLSAPPRRSNSSNVDLETMNQAYCNVVAGACLALGLRYAGSCDEDACRTLLHYAKAFACLGAKAAAELAGRATVEACLNVCLLAAAMVMAGSGDVRVLRLCRRVRARVGAAALPAAPAALPAAPAASYGSQLAAHMALGLLFLGGGRLTLAAHPRAVAALLAAAFPKWPTHSNDNRYHLQALRHLYVLAVEERLLLPRDIDSRQLCFAHLTLHFAPSPGARPHATPPPPPRRVRAPALLPELASLSRVVVEDERYWTIEFNRETNWDQLEAALRSGCVWVKARAGRLPYAEDPQGFRSLLAEALTRDPAAAWSLKADALGAFTSDPALLLFAKLFLEDECPPMDTSAHHGPCGDERGRARALARALRECVAQDKMAALSLRAALLSCVWSLGVIPDPLSARQLHLAVEAALSLCHAPEGAEAAGAARVLPPEAALALRTAAEATARQQRWAQEARALRAALARAAAHAALFALPPRPTPALATALATGADALPTPGFRGSCNPLRVHRVLPELGAGAVSQMAQALLH